MTNDTQDSTHLVYVASRFFSLVICSVPSLFPLKSIRVDFIKQLIVLCRNVFKKLLLYLHILLMLSMIYITTADNRTAKFLYFYNKFTLKCIHYFYIYVDFLFLGTLKYWEFT